MLQKVSEYDQELPQSHTADKPTAPLGRATEREIPGRQTLCNNQLSLPHQDDCNTTKDTKYCTTRLWNKHRTLRCEQQ